MEVSSHRWERKCGLVPGCEANLVVCSSQKGRVHEVLVCCSVFKATVPW